jgi:hypothetical protein
MPTIRLADIPNAGPQALGPSNVGISAPSVPRFAVNPEAAKLTGAAMVDSSIATRGAKSMLDQTLALDAFSKEDAAMGKIAYQVGQIGEVALAYSEKMAKAKDTADLARAETLMRSAFEKQQNDQMNTPVDKWQEKWLANVSETKKALGEIGLSNNAAQSLSPAFDRWDKMSGVQIEGQANKKRIEGYKMDIKANALMKIADEDYEGAFAVINKGVKDGTFSESEGKYEKALLQDNVVRKTKEQKNAYVASTIIQNPIGAEADLEKALETGKSELFPELTEKADIVRAYSNARSEASVYRNNIEDDLDQLILSGELTKPEDIRRVAEGILPERRILSAIETLSKTPAEIEKALAMRPTLLTMVDAYDPAKDDKNRSEYLKIKDSIRQLPEGERGELLQSLRDKWNNPKEATPVTEAASQLKTLFTKGQFGTWTEKDGKMPDSEVPKYLAAGQKFAGFKSDLESWAKANPKEAADKTLVYKKLNEILAADKNVQKIKSGGSSWWYPGSWFAPSKPATSTEDVRKKIDAPPKTSKADSINKKSSKEDIAKAAQEIDYSTPLPELSNS